MDHLGRLGTVIIITLVGFGRIGAGFCPTNSMTIGIKNGDYYLRSGNTLVKYVCNDGFIMYGSSHIACFGDTWSHDPPKCIRATCEKLVPTGALRMEEEYAGALIKFSCAVLHRLVGVHDIICDGRAWSDPVPVCTPWEPPRKCDFEQEAICGYSHHENGDVDWRWNTGSTKTTRTGPDHDHTYGTGATGHYMYFEASSPTRTGYSAILQSPLYPATDSHQRCVNFWYHILGVDVDMGSLQVYIKPESKNVTTLQPLFTVDTNMGKEWQNQTVIVPLMYEPFQVLFTATRGSSYRSDIGLDDVNLYHCDEGFIPTTPGSTAKGATKQSTRTAPSTTIQTRRTRAPTTTTATTTITTTTATTTTATTTTAATTTTPTPTTITRAVPTTVRKTTVRTTTKLPSTTPKASKAPQTTKGYTKAPSPAKTTKLTMTPRINYNVPTKSSLKSSQSDSDGVDMKVVYISVGVVVFVAAVAGVVLGLYFYKRRALRRKSDRSRNGTANPLYTAMENDEAMINFVIDSEYENM